VTLGLGTGVWDHFTIAECIDALLSHSKHVLFGSYLADLCLESAALNRTKRRVDDSEPTTVATERPATVRVRVE
jgi:hypothetical protein